MMKKVIYAVLAFSPVLAFADISGLTSLVGEIGSLIAKIIPIMFAIAIIYFFWGVIKYIQSAGDPKAAAEGKSIMIYGVIAIAVMISVYGLVVFLQGALGIGAPTTTTLPTVTGL